MEKKTRITVICSGEGEKGQYQIMRLTPLGVKRVLKRERCGGDRWAWAVQGVYKTITGAYAGTDCESGSDKFLPDIIAKAAMAM